MTSRANVPGPRPLLPSRLADPQADRAVRDLRQAAAAASSQPAAGLRILAGVELADGVATPMPHGLGRPPLWVRESCVRGASTTGRVDEVRSDDYDRADTLVLMATGWGATITVDIAVL